METYLVTKDNQRYVMHFPDMSQIMKIEGNVKLSGYLIDKDFLVDTNSATNPMNSMSLLSDKPNIPIQVGGNNTVGPENLMVAVVNFSDSSKILFDDQQISSLFLGSQDSAVNNFYKKYSYNKTIFTEKFVTNLDIAINHTCDYGTIKDATIKALDKKINVVDYNRLTVLFHNSACPYGGLGDVIGAKLPATTVSGGTAYFSTNIIPITNLGEPNSFPNFDQFYNFTSRAMNHELGHNLGLNHANFLYCNPSELNLDYCSYSNAESTLNTPHNIEYGSYFSQMGSFGGIDAAEKDRLTWFSDKLSTNNLISTITTSGDYNVLPLDTDLPCQNGTLSCGSKAYKITILNNPPTELPIVVNFALPDGSAVLNPVTFNVDTIHSESISHVDYYLDDKNNNYILCSVTTTPYSCKEVNLTSGLHTITLKAYDHVGRIYQKSLNIQIIYPSTTVVITDPQNNGNIYPQNIFYGSPYYLVKADIKTNIQIDSVYLLMDGNFACDLYYTNMDYECYLPISKLVLNSTHVLTAWATDVSGNPTSSNPITVKYGDNPSITTTIPTTNITTTMPLVTTTFIKRGPLVSGGPVQN